MEYDKVLFFKSVELLINIKSSQLKDRYGLKLAKKTNLGTSRVNQLLNSFRKLGLIRWVELNGRTKNITLTKKGEEIANNLISIRQAK